MALTGERAQAMREDARKMRESVSRDNLEGRLEDAVEERPALKELLEPRPIAIAVGIAALLTLIAALLVSLPAAAIVLVLSFFATWAFLAMQSYERRRPTRDVDEAASERDSDPAPYSG